MALNLRRHHRYSRARHEVRVIATASPTTDALRTSWPDDDLVAAAQRGDTQAFETLMRRYNRRLFRAARSVLRDDDASEDAVQEAYLRAFSNLASYRPIGSFAAWLTRIVINEALLQKRRNRREMVSLDVLDDDVRDAAHHSLADWLSTPDSSNAASARQLLELAVDALPEPFRLVFVLRSVEQLSIAETAQCLQIGEATVKTRLHRAQVRLRETITQRLQNEQLTLFEFGGQRCDRIVAAVLHRLQPSPATSARMNASNDAEDAP
jgi:RNA polymerase sigma-70 factor (ECF subfamily)